VPRDYVEFSQRISPAARLHCVKVSEIVLPTQSLL
jgi:hypothetical protein